MPIEHSNEVDLIQQTLAGDTAAFDRLVKAHRTTVYTLVLSYTKNPADAEDLTQRIFMRAYERLATLRQLDRFLPWLQRITHNTCKDWIRRQGDTTISFEEMDDTDFTETAPSAEDIALKREIEAIVQEAISALTETDRKLVEGRYMEGASYDQLQVESGLSYAAIANRLKRAKQQLRRRIERLLGGMAILPGRTFIWGGIETVKLSVKTKLAIVAIVVIIGIGGGVWYHHTFESNPIVVNEHGISEPEAVTEDASTVESSQPPSEAEIEAAIAALENLHTTSDQSSSTDTDTESSTEQLSSISQSVTPDPPDREQIVAKIQELEAESTAIRKQYLGLIDMANELGAYAHWHGQNAATIEDLDAAYDSVPGTDAAAAERAHKKVMEIIDKFNREQQDIVDTINAVKEEADTLINQRNSILVEIKRLKASIGEK